jgi:hypothetical protein
MRKLPTGVTLLQHVYRGGGQPGGFGKVCVIGGYPAEGAYSLI